MNKMSRYQKLPSDEVETFKTAVFQIHAPTKRKKAMLHDCLYRHHLACDHCLRKIDDHLDNLISKSVKERKQIIKTLIHPIVSNRPLGLAAKDGLRNHIEASVESYVELRNDYEKRITDEDGEVATLPNEFFEKAERGMPQPSDAVSSLNATSKAMKPSKAAIADDANPATSPKAKLKNRA